jgi:[acyl-carrier-protein] S-malonyltransferase
MAEVTAAERPDLLDQAREELGLDPFDHLGEGTRFAQPAIYCASLAHWKRAGSPAAEMVAGHSLGELAALVAGGALRAEDGLALAVLRGRLMEEAGEAKPGGMLAVLGADEEALAVAARLGLRLANDNAPGQLVLSGDLEAIAEARKRLRAAGAKAIRLPVSGAFHSAAMAPAADGFRAALAEVELARPERIVFSCGAAAPFEDIRAGLLAALTEPVRWRETLARMREAGARRFLETGPGDVLTGLVRHTLPEVEARSLAEVEPAHA